MYNVAVCSLHKAVMIFELLNLSTNKNMIIITSEHQLFVSNQIWEMHHNEQRIQALSFL